MGYWLFGLFFPFCFLARILNCSQTFELLTGLWAFHPTGSPDFDLEDDHLARMIELTNEKFPQSFLARAGLAKNYFDDHGECGCKTRAQSS